MCGINGIFAYADSAPPINEAELLRTREHMAKRGPDGAGMWSSEDRRVGLAHRRLAIIDLSESGAQPMATADGRLVVTFNGEIYNYRELRRDLEGKGYVFRSGSDTEVLLHLYAERGPEMVRLLRGMYAFGIWDSARQGLFLARDPFGIKPLYVADDGRTLRFASQVKAIVAGGALEAVDDPAGYAGFLLWGYVPEPFTLHRNIRSLPAGTRLWVPRSGAPAPSCFFSIREEIAAIEQQGHIGREDASGLLSEALRGSVRRHMVADVPVGMFLSAGMDSSLIAGYAAEMAPARFNTVTLGFAEYRGTGNDETHLAEGFAKQIGANHSTQWVGKERFFAEIDAIFAAMDQPTTDGINSYLVSQAAAHAGMKVALSGLGGDELLGGYPSFSDVPRIRRAVRRFPDLPTFARAMRRLTSGLAGMISSPKYAGLLEYGRSVPGAYLLRRALFMPWELSRFLDDDLVAEGLRRLETLPRLAESYRGISNEKLQIAALEMEFYMRGQLLRDADWAGMAHSLEIRVPFVDVEVFKACISVVHAGAASNKREAIAMSGRLPVHVLGRSKTGFSVPVRDWLAQGSVGRASGRGQRLWARRVLRRSNVPRRFLAITSEAYGGFGGISKYNRDVLDAICARDGCREVIAIPRLAARSVGDMPRNLRYVVTGLDGKANFLGAVIRTIRATPRVDMVLCGHINLLPMAWLAARWYGAPIVLFIYGIDAWNAPARWLPRRFIHDVKRVISISQITRDRFLAWSGFDAGAVSVVPNAVHLEELGPGARDPELERRYGLQGKRVLMTLGRMVSLERYKGFDEVLEAMVGLSRAHEDLVYLACGDGSDRARLEKKAASLGISAKVIFTGEIPEHEKAAHYRLADAYVMPSWGEGFGFVLIEAVACGIPAVGSVADGGREALRDGQLGILVNPADPADIERGIRRALAKTTREVPDGLKYFAFPQFAARLNHVLDEVLSDEGGAAGGVRRQPSTASPGSPPLRISTEAARGHE